MQATWYQLCIASSSAFAIAAYLCCQVLQKWKDCYLGSFEVFAALLPEGQQVASWMWIVLVYAFL